MELAFFGAAVGISVVMACIFIPILRKAMREHADHDHFVEPPAAPDEKAAPAARVPPGL